MKRSQISALTVILISCFAADSAVATAKTAGNQGYTHGHRHLKKRLIAKGIKTYSNSSQTKNIGILKGYMDNLSSRINESWESYRINVMRAEITLRLDKDGNIVSTKVKSAKAGRENVNKAIESVKFATPFGALPGNLNSVQFNLTFTDRRVTVEKAAGTNNNTASKPKANSKVNRTSRRNVSKPKTYRPPVSNKPIDVLKEAKELYDFLDN